MSGFELLKKYRKNISEDLFSTLIEIVYSLKEIIFLNQLFKNHLTLRIKPTLDGWEYSNETVTVKDGKKLVVSKDDNQQKIYDSFVRLELPSLITYINLYIRSLSVLKNKVQILFAVGDIGKKVCDIKDNGFYLGKDEKKFKKSILSKIFKGYCVTATLINERDNIEHRFNDRNTFIKFFIDENKPDLNFINDRKSEIQEIEKDFIGSYNEIFGSFILDLEKYLDSKILKTPIVKNDKNWWQTCINFFIKK